MNVLSKCDEGLHGLAMDLSFRQCSGSAVEQLLPGEHLSDVCGFLPELLATELVTVQATQDEEMQEKQQHLLHLKVSNILV